MVEVDDWTARSGQDEAMYRSKIPETIEEAAREFGLVLGSNPIVQKYLDVEQRMAVDPEAGPLKLRLDEVHGEFMERQAAGMAISAGELDAYYALERRVHNHPLLLEQDDRKDQLKDLFSEVNELLSSVLGVNFVELTKE
jgi:cell fate (sporulation/competence/biofilm development) regulator YlbF (YheA/YmcA/DUF963 family)